MDKLQLGLFFVCGFLLSRLIIKVNLPQAIVARLTAARKLSFPRLLLLLLVASAFLSFFIPNVITVLTMLPVINLLREDIVKASGASRVGASTLLTLPVIYGANIGGMGSVTSTPANALLVGYLGIDHHPGESVVSFAVWLGWGVPLVLVCLLGAWMVLSVVQRIWLSDVGIIETHVSRDTGSKLFHRLTVRIGAGIFTGSLLMSFLLLRFPGTGVLNIVITTLLTLFVLYLLFVRRFDGGDGVPRRLLTVRDCYSDLPWRGFLLLAVVIGIGALLFMAGDFFRDLAAAGAAWIPEGTSPLLVFFVFALIISFATELLSNTVVQITAFTVCVPLAQQLGMDVVPLLIVATLSSTSAYMSPLATGVNGLAFGGMRGVSLWRMLVAGTFMNVVGAALIAVWGTMVVPLFY